MYDNLSRVIEVDINEVLPNRFQPRIQFDEEEILELSDSIKEHGVIQPLVVRTIGDKYEIIAGERRYKASVLAGKETVPVIIKNLNDKDSAEVALIENIQRKNLTPIEEALSYKKILDMGYITQENLASKLGKSQSSVANKIRLLNLSDEVQEALLENKISERHARSLLKLSLFKQQNEMLNRIISERLTVRRADEEIEKLKNNPSDEGNDDKQKIIEKGEIDMNNNMFGMPNIPQNAQSSIPSFDIFGGSAPVGQNSPEMQSMATPVQDVPSMSFDQNNQTLTQTESSSVPEINGMSSMLISPTGTTPSMPQTSSFDILGGSAPVGQNSPEMSTTPTDNMFAVPTTPSFESTPSVQTIPEMPAASTENMFAVPATPSFESTPSVQTIPETPAASTENMFAVPTALSFESTPSVQTVPEIPTMAPIIESSVVDNSNKMTQQSENLFSFGTSNINSMEPSQPEPQSIPEFKMPEPIIVTDYTKQYDPVMPQTGPVIPTVDFKEVINAIRECSNKIEQYGFKIDVEEYDLANLYQVIFKIEK